MESLSSTFMRPARVPCYCYLSKVTLEAWALFIWCFFVTVGWEHWAVEGIPKLRVFKQTPTAAPASESEHHLDYAFSRHYRVLRTHLLFALLAVNSYLSQVSTSTCRRGKSKSGYLYILYNRAPAYGLPPCVWLTDRLAGGWFRRWVNTDVYIYKLNCTE